MSLRGTERSREVLAKCQTCPKSIGGGATKGEARALGWRIWDGLTLTGASKSVRICPTCIGANDEGEEAEDDGIIRGFKAECTTCDADMDEDWADEKPKGGWSEEDAKAWRSDHKCEPWVNITPPKVMAGVR